MTTTAKDVRDKVHDSESTRRRPTVGFVGSGNMGMPMILRLHEDGYQLSVFARRPEAISVLKEHGVTLVAELSEIVSSDVVIVCVDNEEHVHAVVLGEYGVLESMQPGSLLIVHTTCSPAGFDRVLAAAATRGVHVVDAPLEGVPSDFAASTGKIYVGTTEAKESEVRALLGSYASVMVRCGDPGDAQRNKVLNVILTAANAHLVEASVALAEALGLDPKKALQAVTAGSNSASVILEYSLAFGDRPAEFLDAIRPFLHRDVLNYDDFLNGLEVPTGVLCDAARLAAQGEISTDDSDRSMAKLQTAWRTQEA